MTTDELLYKAIEKWGKESQLDMAIEECSELIVECANLIKAIQKRRRNKVTDEKIIEEGVDVELCLEQLKLMLNNPKLWEQKREDKLKRLEGLLE